MKNKKMINKIPFKIIWHKNKFRGEDAFVGKKKIGSYFTMVSRFNYPYKFNIDFFLKGCFIAYKNKKYTSDACREIIQDSWDYFLEDIGFNEIKNYYLSYSFMQEEIGREDLLSVNCKNVLRAMDGQIFHGKKLKMETIEDVYIFINEYGLISLLEFRLFGDKSLQNIKNYFIDKGFRFFNCEYPRLKNVGF